MRVLLRSLALAGVLLVATTSSADPGSRAPRAFAAPAWLGISMSARAADAHGGGSAGVGVEHVVRGSPADKGGLKSGDRIVSVDGAKVLAPRDVSLAVQMHPAGDTVAVELERAGSAVKTSIVLATRPSGDEILRMDLVGAFAPAFTNVTPLSGAPSSLASLRGKVVLVDFWASWCGPCRAVAPRLSALKDRYGAQGLTVVGVTTDPAEKAAVFAERLQMRYPSVVDKDGDTSKVYGITNLPTMLLVDKRGVVRDVFVGFDPGGEAQLESIVKTLLAEPASSAPAPAPPADPAAKPRPTPNAPPPAQRAPRAPAR